MVKDHAFDKIINDLKFKGYIQNVFIEKVKNFESEAVLEVELTNQCTISCSYCGIYSGEMIYNLDYEWLVKSIDDFIICSKKSGFQTASLSLSGGDPFLYPEFSRLLKLLKEKDIPFGIKGNPSSVTERHIDILKKNSCRMVKMTFIGDESIYKKYRKGDHPSLLFEKTALLKRNEIPVIWHFTTGRFNYKNLIELLPTVNSIKPSAVSLGRIANMGRKKADIVDIHLSPEEYRNFLISILIFFYKNHRNGFNLMFREKLWVPLLSELGILELSRLPRNKAVLGCDAYSRLTTITYDGKLLSCGLLPSLTLGSLDSGDRIKEVINNRPVSRQDQSVCHSCMYGAYCRGCRGITLANTGSLYNQDPQCWIQHS